MKYVSEQLSNDYIGLLLDKYIKSHNNHYLEEAQKVTRGGYTFYAIGGKLFTKEELDNDFKIESERMIRFGYFDGLRKAGQDWSCLGAKDNGDAYKLGYEKGVYEADRPDLDVISPWQK